MNDRGMKKWRPFNSVVPGKVLLNLEEKILLPDLSPSEVEEYEEILKISMYTHSKVKITYIENGHINIIEDYVDYLEPIKKDIKLHNKKINFRQIVKVQL